MPLSLTRIFYTQSIQTIIKVIEMQGKYNRKSYKNRVLFSLKK